MSDDSRTSRLARVRGLMGVAVSRVVNAFTTTDTRRITLSVTGVALTIGLMLVITGVAVGLAEHNTVRSESVDYWIVPESGSDSTLVFESEAPKFGEAHGTNARIEDIEGVTHSSPVLVSIHRLSAPGGPSEYVLLLGVIPREGFEIEGIATDTLTPGDPYYTADNWTGELILTDGAATLLNASQGTELEGASGRTNQSLRVVNVSKAGVQGGFTQLPIGVMHLSELQAMSGAEAGDQADQFLVSSDTPAVKQDLEAVYPRSTVLTRSGLTTQSMGNELPLAMSLASLLVAVVIGTLFIGTTMGLEITADRQQYAVMRAVGVPFSSLGILVGTQTVTITLVGGLLGIGLGGGGIVLTNHLVRNYFGTGSIASFHPLFIGYGLIVALVIGMLVVPYLLWLTRRTDILRELGR